MAHRKNSVLHRAHNCFLGTLLLIQLSTSSRADVTPQIEPLPSTRSLLAPSELPLPAGPLPQTFSAADQPAAAAPNESWAPADDSSVQNMAEPLSELNGGNVCESCVPTGFDEPANHEPWELTVMPKTLIYHSYLAGPWEPRFGSVWNRDRTRGWLWDIGMGGRVGLFRYGTKDCSQPDGWQVDLEGGVFPQLDPERAVDLNAMDFRFGLPVTYGRGPYQMKFGFYHISSHLGDEFMQDFPATQRINFGRNALAWGHSYYLSPALRIYGEADWAWDCEISEPWYFQFGFDWAPILAPGNHMAPFIAVNTQLRQELDFGGQFVVQAGVAFRHGAERRMFRIGMNYYNGGNQQFEFYNTNEQKLGLGLWYDY